MNEPTQRRPSKPVLLLAACGAALAACVNSKVEQLRTVARPAQIGAGESVVVLGRRHRGDRESEDSFNQCITRSLRERQMPVYAEQAFVDALFPWLEPRTAPMSAEGFGKLLERPLIAERLRATGVRFMVWIDGETEKVDGGGSVGCGITVGVAACLGFGWWENESRYEVSIWDTRDRSSVGKVTVNASGTSYMPAVIIPIPLIARTEAAACAGIAGQIDELLAPARKPRS